MKFYENGKRYTAEEKEELKKQGKFVAEIRGAEERELHDTIEKNVWANHIGSIITNEEIDFGKYDKFGIVDYNEFCAENEQVNSIEEL